MIPYLNARQAQVMRALRAHGSMTSRQLVKETGILESKIPYALTSMRHMGCIERVKASAWRWCDTWAKRIIITETGVEHV